jgi:hypothetical protein
MAALQYTHPDIFDYGLDRLKTATTSVVLVDYAYVAGDSYAILRGVADANVIAETTGVVDADIVLSASGTGRKAIVAASQPTAIKQSGGVADRLRFAALDTVNLKVLDIWQETSNQIIYVGNLVDIPALVHIKTQPT